MTSKSIPRWFAVLSTNACLHWTRLDTVYKLKPLPNPCNGDLWIQNKMNQDKRQCQLMMFDDVRTAFKLTNTVPLVALDALESRQIDAHCLTNPKSQSKIQDSLIQTPKSKQKNRSKIQTFGYWILDFGDLFSWCGGSAGVWILDLDFGFWDAGFWSGEACCTAA